MKGFSFGCWWKSNLLFVWGFSCLSGGMSVSGSDEAPSKIEVLSKKKKSSAAYKGYLSTLEKDIAMFLNLYQEIRFIYQN